MRRHAYVLKLALGLFLLGCGVPEYRIKVEGIPQDTVQLQVATYVLGSIAIDSPTFDVLGPRDSYTFGLNLTGVPEGEATISVGARRADGCLLAVGTRVSVPPESNGSDAELPLIVPTPAITTATCTADPPVILAVLRSLEGPLQTIRYSLLLQGWGFQPAATVSVHSTASVQCATGSACNEACPTACTSTGMGTGGPGSGTCLTGCTVKISESDVVHSGPALIQVNLDATKNLLQQPSMTGSGGAFVQPIDLLQLLSQPLQITVTNPDQKASLFQEAAMKSLGG